MTFYVIKRIKGIPYLYKQTSIRYGDRVYSDTTYIGRATEKDIKKYPTKKERLLRSKSSIDKVNSSEIINTTSHKPSTRNKDGKVNTTSNNINKENKLKIVDIESYNVNIKPQTNKVNTFSYMNKNVPIRENKLGITDNNVLRYMELEHLRKATHYINSMYNKDTIFSEKDVIKLHGLFLGDIYNWAGNYRNYDISSEQIRWAHAQYIPQLMKDYGKLLGELTPFNKEMSTDKIIEDISKIHGELIIIHPFQDGNGRTTRFLCDTILSQAEKEVNSYKFYDDKIIEEYHKAIIDIWARVDYTRLKSLYNELID